MSYATLSGFSSPIINSINEKEIIDQYSLIEFSFNNYFSITSNNYIPTNYSLLTSKIQVVLSHIFHIIITGIVIGKVVNKANRKK